MVNVFIQVNKQFYYNALNDHNVKYSRKGWSPLTGSVILRLSRSGLDSTERLEVKGSVASGARVLTQRATSASFCERGIRMIILVDDDISKGL